MEREDSYCQNGKASSIFSSIEKLIGGVDEQEIANSVLFKPVEGGGGCSEKNERNNNNTAISINNNNNIELLLPSSELFNSLNEKRDIGSFVGKEDMKNSNNNSSLSSSIKNKKNRKPRAIFTAEQIFHLEEAFEKTQYPDFYARKDLSIKLNLCEARVKVWFQNRRVKKRKVTKHLILTAAAARERKIKIAGENPTSSSYNLQLENYLSARNGKFSASISAQNDHNFNQIGNIQTFLQIPSYFS